MNDGIYGHILYGRQRVAKQKERRSVAVASLYASISLGTGRYVNRSSRASVTMQGDFVLDIAHIRKTFAKAELKSQIELINYTIRLSSGISNLNTKIRLNSDNFKSSLGVATLESKVKLNKLLHKKNNAYFAMQNSTVLARTVFRQSKALALLNSFIDVISTSSESMFINVPIPNGSRLVIDTENFTITLDGVNVIDKHMTDVWIELDRDLIDLVVDAGGDTNGLLAYKEWYL